MKYALTVNDRWTRWTFSTEKDVEMAIAMLKDLGEMPPNSKYGCQKLTKFQQTENAFVAAGYHLMYPAEKSLVACKETGKNDFKVLVGKDGDGTVTVAYIVNGRAFGRGEPRSMAFEDSPQVLVAKAETLFNALA